MCCLEFLSSESSRMLVIKADSQSRLRLSESKPLRWGPGNFIKKKAIIFSQVDLKCIYLGLTISLLKF